MTDDDREYFEERAAILEYDAGFSREAADRRVREELSRRREVEI